jgi:transposase
LRTRRQLVRERTCHVQRLQKVLEDANVKLESVISDIMGISGRAMILALIAGEADPAKLAELAHRRIKAGPDSLTEALRGRITRHHRFLLDLHMKQIKALDGAIASIDQEVGANLEPFRQAISLLTTIPGVGDLSAREIVAEIGIDMSRFPTHGHLLSWAGLCPRNDESAGKRRSTRMRKGSHWLKTTLVQCAWAAIKKKDSYLRAQFHRLRARRGAKKPSAPSPPQSWSQSSTCSRTAPTTRIPEPITSIETPRPPQSASAIDWRTSAMTSASLPKPPPDRFVSC